MNDEHETEQALFDRLNREFHFVVDLAASPRNHKLKHYLSPENGEDALVIPWIQFDGWCWLNPPYSRGLIDKFMARVCAEAANDCFIVALTRFDPSATWFQSFVHNKAAEIRMLQHRVRFVDQPSAYNFPCCVALYPGRLSRKSTYRLWSWR